MRSLGALWKVRGAMGGVRGAFKRALGGLLGSSGTGSSGEVWGVLGGLGCLGDCRLIICAPLLIWLVFSSRCQFYYEVVKL